MDAGVDPLDIALSSNDAADVETSSRKFVLHVEGTPEVSTKQGKRRSQSKGKDGGQNRCRGRAFLQERLGDGRGRNVRGGEGKSSTCPSLGSENEARFECDFCRKKYTKKSALIVHIKQHSYACNICASSFALKRELKCHVEKTHGPQMYECSVCDYKSNKKWTLKDHFIRKHTDEYHFSCKFCGKLFKIQNNLKQHINQMHSGAPPILCDFCGHASKNLHALKSHIKYIHDKPEYVCKICKRRLVSQKGLEQHLHWHETKERVVCEQCGKTFHIPYDLEVHMRSHTGVRPYACSVCKQSFARRNTLRQHLLIHTGKRPYVCDICGKSFTQKPGLTSHRKSHPGSHPQLPSVYIDSILKDLTQLKSEEAKDRTETSMDPLCIGQGKRQKMPRRIVVPQKRQRKPQLILPKPSTASAGDYTLILPKAYLLINEEKVVGNQEPPEISEFKSESLGSKADGHLCRICDAIFPKRLSLVKHIKVHEHRCDACAIPFKDKESLENHMKTHKHLFDAKSKYPCKVCSYVSKNKRILEAHFIRKHTDAYNYFCEICGKQYKVKNDLRTHMIKYHSGNPPVVCDVCGRSCVDNHTLKVHQKFAHFKPKYKCVICPKRMVSQENLDQHMLWHQEKVICEECGKAFSEKCSLVVHMRTHTGDKPYPCPVCGKSFARSGAQRQHILTHTGQRPYVCDICGKSFTQKPGLICHRKTHPGPLPPLPPFYIDGILKKFEEDVLKKSVKGNENESASHAKN